MGVCTKERKGVTAEVLMATPCTNSLGGESGGHRHDECTMKEVRGDQGAQFLLEVRRRFLVGSGRLSMLMLVRSGK